jgi:serine protease AprX
MKKYYLLLIVVLGHSVVAKTQSKCYSVQLKNKQGTSFSINNPAAFLSPKAVEKRRKYNIPIDSTDLPCTIAYIDSIQSAGAVTLLHTSKWFNQIAIRTDDATAIEKIKNFSFVSNVSLIASSSTNKVNKNLNTLQYNEDAKLLAPKKILSEQSINDFYSYGQSFGQVHIHNGEFLHNHGFDGKGIKMCITDGGFLNYKTSPGFDSVRKNNQILATWDFVANDTSVNEDHIHGSLCFSNIAANIPGVFVGTAPKASFYLYRTEDVFSEMPIEEQNWAAAAEKADALGVDVISVSLGYTTFDNAALNHTYNDMNGNTTLISKAADMAAKKGMIVVVSAGNSGTDAWHFISAPADGDSVLTIGAVNTAGQVANFSSYGPSSDGQIKPDVAAVGLNAIVVHPTNGLPFAANGTSFACPNLAGLTACLWQAFPEVNNMSVISAIQKSANQYKNPDDRTGYGIPDMKKALAILVKQLYTQNITATNCTANILFSVKSDTGTTFNVERKLANEKDYSIIHTQQGTGNFTMKNFAYADDLGNAALGLVKYRIRMQISADTTFYLDSASINFAQLCKPPTQKKITISPNPVLDKLNILVKENDGATVEILIQTPLGQKTFYTKKQQITNNEQFSIPFTKMGRGIYFVTVFINGEKTEAKKILY